jgi:hypothetical protein
MSILHRPSVKTDGKKCVENKYKLKLLYDKLFP